MARLGRYTQLLFGSSASSNQMAEFGSLAAGSPARYSGATVTPAIIQTLANYLSGWFGAVIGVNSPTIEDMNAICYLFSFQLAYILQLGMPEWDSGTTYYIGSIAQVAGVSYVSKTDSNLNNAPATSSANWKLQNSPALRDILINSTLVATDQYIRVDTSLLPSDITVTLPAIATVPVGWTITIKQISATLPTATFTTVQANGAERIDNATIYPTPLAAFDSLTVYNTGSQWDVI